MQVANAPLVEMHQTFYDKLRNLSNIFEEMGLSDLGREISLEKKCPRANALKGVCNFRSFFFLVPKLLCTRDEIRRKSERGKGEVGPLTCIDCSEQTSSVTYFEWRQCL